jgi:hypothetical protein
MLPLLEVHERKLTNTKGKKSAIKKEQQPRKNHLDLHTREKSVIIADILLHPSMARPCPPIVSASTVHRSPPGVKKEPNKRAKNASADTIHDDTISFRFGSFKWGGRQARQ